MYFQLTWEGRWTLEVSGLVSSLAVKTVRQAEDPRPDIFLSRYFFILFPDFFYFLLVCIL